VQRQGSPGEQYHIERKQGKEGHVFSTQAVI
jgi:hypothetical protein